MERFVSFYVWGIIVLEIVFLCVLIFATVGCKIEHSWKHCVYRVSECNGQVIQVESDQTDSCRIAWGGGAIFTEIPNKKAIYTCEQCSILLVDQKNISIEGK